MSLPELSIQRHVLAYMMSAVLVLFGLIGFQRLGVDRFPNIDFPVIAVTTVQPGGNPSVIDASITSVIERQVNSVPGIESIRSSSTPSVSVVTISFDLKKDVDVAFNEVQAKVNQVLNELPDDADPPVVAKLETDAQPILWLALSGDRTLQQLNVYANNVLRKQLENISGVGEVRIGGERERTIRVELFPGRLAANNLNVQEVLGAFRNEHFLLPGGFLVGNETEVLLDLDLEYHTPQSLEQMIIAYRNGAPVRLGDIGRVEDALADYRQLARYNGEPAVGLGIVKISGTNTVAIIDAVKATLEEEIRPQLPPGLDITIASDTSTFILEMVHALQEHLISGTILAALVVLLFLRNFRSTLIIATAIPVSLFGAIAVMYFFGYTFNSITLLALLLLIGVVVDDAIVVLENVYRHREEGLEDDPASAALAGTEEVMFAVLAATLSLVSIFVPVIFMGGIIGRFFESFAVVVVFGVLVSWFVALTLTPMLCARFLKVSDTHGPIFNAFERTFRSLEQAYQRLVRAVLATPVAVPALVLVGTIVVTVFSGAAIAPRLSAGFVPPEDIGQIFIRLKAPLGASIEYTDKRLQQVEAILKEEELIGGYFAAIGAGDQGQVNEASLFVDMIPRDERDLSQQDYMVQLNERLRSIPGVQAFATEPPAFGGRPEPLQFALRGRNLEQVATYAERLARELRASSTIKTLDLVLKLDLPQVKVEIDRERATSLGLNTRQVAEAINVLAGGVDVARYNDAVGDGERYDIRLKGAEEVFQTPEDLKRILLRTNNGGLVRLDSVADLSVELGPAEVSRYDLQYAALFYADPTQLGDAVARLDELAAEILPAGYTIEPFGQAKELEDTAGYATFALIVAIVLLYMVLASQFNSFVQPIIIMVALPLAVTGAFGGLWVLGYGINIFSVIGMLLLVGLVAKNSILLVELTNQRREQGMNIRDALIAACPTRLRPVLMTSLTVIFALLPAALGYGAGADTNGPLSAAVIGGMITSTALTLIAVPAAYALMEGAVQWLRGDRSGAHGSSEGGASHG